MKLLLCALALFTTLAPVLAQDAATPPATTESRAQTATLPAVKLDNGISVTPVLRPASDLETMMDVHFWQFQLQLPATKTFTSARLELRAPGKPTRIVSSSIPTFLQNNAASAALTVGIAPIASESLSVADKWKVHCRMQATPQDSDKPTLGSNSGFTNTPTNLLKELRNLNDLKYQFQITRYGIGDDYALPQANGDIPLITVYGKDSGDEPTLVGELVLVLTDEPAATN